MDRPRSLLERLRALVRRGIDPVADAMLPEHKGLVDELIVVHGSLSHAREAIDVHPRLTYCRDEDALDVLRRLARAEPRLTPRRLRQLGEEMLLKYIYARFGSLGKARTLAGLPANIESPRMTRADAVAELRRLVDEAPRLKARDVTGRLRGALIEHFGTLSAAFAAIGKRTGIQKWTTESVIEALAARMVAGLPITAGALNAEGRNDLVNAVVRHVGGFRDARRHAERIARKCGAAALAMELVLAPSNGRAPAPKKRTTARSAKRRRIPPAQVFLEAGGWVAVANGRVVAHAATREDVSQAAASRGHLVRGVSQLRAPWSNRRPRLTSSVWKKSR